MGVRSALAYQISKNWLIGGQYLGSYGKPSANESDRIEIKGAPSGTLDSIVNTVATDHRKLNTHSLNLHTEVKLDSTGRKASLNIDYFTYQNDISRDFNTRNLTNNDVLIPGSFLSTNSTGDQRINNFAAKIDIDHPLKWARLSYGAKVNFTQTDNDSRYFNTTSGQNVLDLDRSNVFNYRENTQAAYLSGSRKLHKQFDLQIGLRFENTQTTGLSETDQQTHKNNYFQVFPTAYLTYKPNDDHFLGLSYGRRISRPSYARLNPFKFYSSAYTYTEGNPFLQPQFSNNLKILHSYKDRLSTSLAFTHETQGFEQIPFIDPDTKIQYYTQLNYFKFTKLTLGESYTFNDLTWLENESEGQLYYSHSSFIPQVGLQNTNTVAFYISNSSTVILNKARTLQTVLNAWYQSKEYDLIYQSKPYYSVDLGFRLILFKNKLQLNAIAQDLFKTNRQNESTYTNHIQQTYSSYLDRRSLRVSLTYKFGNSKINVKKRDFGDEDEKRRAGS